MRMKILCLILAVLLVMGGFALAQPQYLQPWWIDTGETDSTGLGTSIAPLGDINADGYADFIVGSANEMAFVYFGSQEPDTIPDMIIPSPSDSVSLFGISINNVGDVNADGGDDLIFGAAITETPPQHWMAFLFYGGGNLDSLPDLSFDGPMSISASTFGYKAVGIGDFNRDGGNDFVILDMNYVVEIAPNNKEGRIYLYYGGTQLDSLPDLVIEADSTLDYIGEDAAGLGDVNGDGYNDFAMADERCTGPAGEYCGVAAIYCGAQIPDATPDWVVFGDSAWVRLGFSVVGVDFDGDGQKDLGVSNSHDYPPNHNSSIFIYLVSPDMDSLPDCILPSEDGPGYGFDTGNDLEEMDLNSDGHEDIISSQPNAVLGAGKVWVYLGNMEENPRYDAYYFASNLGGGLGHGANVGDINGDSIEDLIVSEPGFDQYPGGQMWGRIFCFLGDPDIHQSVGIAPQESTPIAPISLNMQVHPNPFNATIKIDLNWSGNQVPALLIYNLKGQIVRALPIQAGQRQIIWNGLSDQGLPVSSGIYLTVATIGHSRIIRKVVLLR